MGLNKLTTFVTGSMAPGIVDVSHCEVFGPWLGDRSERLGWVFVCKHTVPTSNYVRAFTTAKDLGVVRQCRTGRYSRRNEVNRQTGSWLALTKWKAEVSSET